ncbi:MAG: hypothetical protein QM653_07180 [Dysgonomonas sp.]|uniref:hypothetical protein n=1 Tax=Dysgonomonas sp. TaxID=1891233 RepID=UPI0039E592CC
MKTIKFLEVQKRPLGVQELNEILNVSNPSVTERKERSWTLGWGILSVTIKIVLFFYYDASGNVDHVDASFYVNDSQIYGPTKISKNMPSIDYDFDIHVVSGDIHLILNLKDENVQFKAHVHTPFKDFDINVVL